MGDPYFLGRADISCEMKGTEKALFSVHGPFKVDKGWESIVKETDIY